MSRHPVSWSEVFYKAVYCHLLKQLMYVLIRFVLAPTRLVFGKKFTTAALEVAKTYKERGCV